MSGSEDEADAESSPLQDSLRGAAAADDADDDLPPSQWCAPQLPVLKKKASISMQSPEATDEDECPEPGTHFLKIESIGGEGDWDEPTVSKAASRPSAPQGSDQVFRPGSQGRPSGSLSPAKISRASNLSAKESMPKPRSRGDSRGDSLGPGPPPTPPNLHAWGHSDRPDTSDTVS